MSVSSGSVKSSGSRDPSLLDVASKVAMFARAAAGPDPETTHRTSRGKSVVLPAGFVPTRAMSFDQDEMEAAQESERLRKSIEDGHVRRPTNALIALSQEVEHRELEKRKSVESLRRESGRRSSAPKAEIGGGGGEDGARHTLPVPTTLKGRSRGWSNWTASSVKDGEEEDDLSALDKQQLIAKIWDLRDLRKDEAKQTAQLLQGLQDEIDSLSMQLATAKKQKDEAESMASQLRDQNGQLRSDLHGSASPRRGSGGGSHPSGVSRQSSLSRLTSFMRHGSSPPPEDSSSSPRGVSADMAANSASDNATVASQLSAETRRLQEENRQLLDQLARCEAGVRKLVRKAALKQSPIDDDGDADATVSDLGGSRASNSPLALWQSLRVLEVAMDDTREAELRERTQLAEILGETQVTLSRITQDREAATKALHSYIGARHETASYTLTELASLLVAQHEELKEASRQSVSQDEYVTQLENDLKDVTAKLWEMKKLMWKGQTPTE